MTIYYKMRGRDVDAPSLTFRSWVVANIPDLTGAQYTGPKSGGSALADVYISSVRDDGGIQTDTVPDFSPVNFMMANSNPVSNSSLNQGSGTAFRVTRACSLLGIRFYWAVSSKTVKLSLWNLNTSARVNSITVFVPTAGLYSFYFSSPISLTPFVQYSTVAWETDSGAFYTTQTSLPTVPSVPFFSGPYLIWTNFKIYGTNDTVPNTTAGSENYPTEPIIIGNTQP